ncbi:MAG: MoxR family ATPase [Candidatus Sumerlaeales bacterium]|nr:MoxR family ATPase [Candidatus Sumerlaeales bacterium]
MNSELEALSEEIRQQSVFIESITQELNKMIVGQRQMVERLLIGLLSNGHVLLEGVPGLAKTMTVKSLATVIDGKYSRIQFTPDLLPADVVGTIVYNQHDHTFVPKLGPVFANLVLADEINRAPAKVQSALLEAMQEHQITLGDTTYKLPEPFLVMATQNPIEQEGTYPLPEAQVDRFMLKLRVTYPSKREERDIMDRVVDAWLNEDENPFDMRKVATCDDIMKARQIVRQIYVDDKVRNYIISLVFATRQPQETLIKDGPQLARYIQFGASPRATIFLTLAAKAYAYLRRRAHVTPDDVKTIALEVLRHRLKLSYEAEADEVSADEIVKAIIEGVEVP